MKNIQDFHNISIAGIDHADNKHTDAYADYAEINGRSATDEELDILSDMLHEDQDQLIEIIRGQIPHIF